MNELEQQLNILKNELKTLVPSALKGLVESGTLTADDPLDAVGISYATVGSDSVWHGLSVRTVETRRILEEAEPDCHDLPWNTSEHDVDEDLADLVQVGELYSETCNRLTKLIVDVSDAREWSDDDPQAEFTQLRAAVTEVARWLTKNWKPEGVPAVAHPIFFAIDEFLDAPGDTVARSVDPKAMLLAGLKMPPREQ